MKRYNRISDIQDDLKEKKLTLTNLVNYYLSRIDKHKGLNAFVEVFADEALSKAHQMDEEINATGLLPLTGAIIGIKDILCYRSHQVTAASKILEGFNSLYSATAIKRLTDNGAIIIGRLNCDEFAMGSSNENSTYGPVLNAADDSRVAGGSSGGSAAAVQADLCLATLGTDTGGSIRLPASFTGIAGFKPTYGRISRYGLLAYASSFDQIGPLTRSVEDAALLTEIMAGEDEYDSTCSSHEVPSYSQMLETESTYKIGYYNQVINEKSLDKEIKARMSSIIDDLQSDSHEVSGAEQPLLDFMVPAYYILTTAEASSNLARYDGIRYGYRDLEARNMDEVYKKSRSIGFGKEVKRRIMLGTFVLSAGYYNDYYSKAQKIRRIIHDSSVEDFRKFDFIISPTTVSPAFKVGEKTKDPIAMYLSDLFTVQANLAGLPAISLPLGTTKSGLPFGIQVMAKKYDEARLLAFSKYLMKRYSDNSD